MIAGMKQELTDIQSRFAENVAESSELEELFNSLDLNSVDFNFRIPHNDDLEESHFGKGLTGARNLALAFMRGWTGQSGGLQPSMGPEEGLLALYSGIKGLAALAGRSFTLGGVTATFSKGLSNNVRSFFRSFRQGADEAAEAATRNTPCPPRGSNPGVIKNNPANKKIETGVPRTNGGWVKRWIRMSDDDYARWREERFDYYNRVVDLSRRLRLTPEEATRFRFNQMQKWRENWLRDFLESRTY